MKDTPIIDAECTDVDIAQLLAGVKVAGVGKGQHYPKDRTTGEKIKYLDIITAFDIETSRHKFHNWGWQSWLYHWQWQFGEVCTIVGRRWESFLYLVGKLNFYLESIKARILVYVHELAYEFQFISGIWHFDAEDIFATGQYAPLRCNMGKIEMRCSRRLANCSLEDWGSKRFHVDHQKLAGTMDHDKERFPWTPLTEDELKYCVNDVICVVECVQELMKQSGKNLYYLPLTAIGFVRKRCRDAVYMWCKGGIRDMQNPLYVYDRLRQANRGGDNYLSDDRREQLMGDVESWDRSSSYPDVIVHCKFPMTRFKEEEPTMENFKFLVEHGKAVLAKVAFYKIRQKQNKGSLRYIPYLKCTEKGFKRPVKPVIEEGRIESAEYLEIAVTDIDMELIYKYYEWDGMDIEWMMSARYGYLPQLLIDEIIRLYKMKTELKGDPERTSEYSYIKTLLNSIYGMMSQRVIYSPVIFDQGEWKIVEINREEEYAKAIESAYLNYAWSVWVTAWGRYRLHEGIWAVMKQDPDAFVYADTDSVKTRIIKPDFSEINKKRIADAKASGAFATGLDGIVHYLGAYEQDGVYKYFRALNVKRYCTVGEDGKLSIHVSGVPKQKGAEVLLAHGGILAFDYSFVFYGSGQTRSIMNDFADINLTIEGHHLHIGRNVAVVPIEEVGDYDALVSWANAVVDMIEFMDYNPGE